MAIPVKPLPMKASIPRKAAPDGFHANALIAAMPRIRSGVRAIADLEPGGSQGAVHLKNFRHIDIFQR